MGPAPTHHQDIFKKRLPGALLTLSNYFDTESDPRGGQVEEWPTGPRFILASAAAAAPWTHARVFLSPRALSVNLPRGVSDPGRVGPGSSPPPPASSLLPSLSCPTLPLPAPLSGPGPPPSLPPPSPAPHLSWPPPPPPRCPPPGSAAGPRTERSPLVPRTERSTPGWRRQTRDVRSHTFRVEGDGERPQLSSRPTSTQYTGQWGGHRDSDKGQSLVERTRQSKREAQRGDSKDTTEKETYRESYPTMGAQYKGLPKIHSVGYRVCVYRDEVSSCLRVGDMRRGRGSAVAREQRNKNRRREKNTTIEIRSNSDARTVVEGGSVQNLYSSQCTDHDRT